MNGQPMMPGGMPVLIMREGTQRETGRNAQRDNIAAARAVADAVKSTLGPMGMDKLIVDTMGDIVITNDGVTILKTIDVEHPAAKMMVEVADTQDEECGDGTTTAVILAGELLKKAEELLEQRVHPTSITEGYRLASIKAQKVLEQCAMKLDPDDTRVLLKVAGTAVTGKNAAAVKERLADLAVEAVRLVRDDDGKIDLDNILVQKKTGGSTEDTGLVNGLIIDKRRKHNVMPKHLAPEGGVKVALMDVAFEPEQTQGVKTEVRISDPSQLPEYLKQEEEALRKMVLSLADSGARALFTSKAIDDRAGYLMSKAGIYAVNRVSLSDMEKLARATGGTVVGNINDLTDKDLGSAKVVREDKIGDDEMTFVEECDGPRAVSILIRGGTDHVIDEVHRALVDALGVVRAALLDARIVAGGGSTSAEVGMALLDYAQSVGGREQMAVEAYARAMDVVPKSLAENAGLDGIDVMIEMRTAHKEGNVYHGVQVGTGKVVDMAEENVLEPLRVESQAIASATEAAIMILRIDDVIMARGSEPPAGAGPQPRGPRPMGAE